MRLNNLFILFFITKSICSWSQILGVEDMEWIKTATVDEINKYVNGDDFDTSIVNIYNKNALHYAAQNSNPEISGILIESGVVFDKPEKCSSFTAAMHAVENSNEKVLELFLNNDVSPNQKRVSYLNSERGISLLTIAASNSNIEVIKLLLAQGADLSFRTEMGGETALMQAARYNTNPDILKLLIKSGLKVNDTNDFNETAFTIALEKSSDEDIIRLLISNGADIGAEVNGKNILELIKKNEALKSGAIIEELETLFKNYSKDTSINNFYNTVSNGTYEEVVEAYEVAGRRIIREEIDQRQKAKTTIMYACQFQTDKRVIDFLIDKGVWTSGQDESGWSAIHYASAFNKNPKIISAVLDDLDYSPSTTEDGQSHLELAVLRPDGLEIVKLLLEDVVNDDSIYLLHEVLRKGKGNKESIKEVFRTALASEIDKSILEDTFYFIVCTSDLDYVKFLLENGFQFNVKELSSENSIHSIFAAIENEDNPGVLRLLLNNGADPNYKDNWGVTPLYQAVLKDNVEAIEDLITAGAVVYNLTTEDDLLWNVGSVKALKILVDNGADIHKRYENNRTLLMSTRNAAVIKELVRMGCDTKAVDDNGDTALDHIARPRGPHEDWGRNEAYIECRHLFE